MSGMLAVSKPPMIWTLGLRSIQASVIGRNVCHEANHPKTRSARATAGTTFSGLGTRPGWYRSSTSYSAARIARSIATKLALRLCT